MGARRPLIPDARRHGPRMPTSCATGTPMTPMTPIPMQGRRGSRDGAPAVRRWRRATKWSSPDGRRGDGDRVPFGRATEQWTPWVCVGVMGVIGVHYCPVKSDHVFKKSFSIMV